MASNKTVNSRDRQNFRLIINVFLLVLAILAPAAAGCTKTRKPKVRKGWIYVTTEPTLDATITLDGKTTGKTSNAVLKNIKTGRHRLELKKSNPNRPELPFIGSANIYLKPGQKLRVTVQLNVMAIQPRESTTTAVVAATEGQKSTLDFYKAINNKDYATAYGLISYKYKKSYSYSYRTFVRNWQNVNNVTVNSIAIKKASAADGGPEIDTLNMTITYNPLPKPTRRRRYRTPLAGQTNPDQAGVSQWDITTVGGSAESGGLWKVDNISAAGRP